MGAPYQNLADRVFGRLTVISEASRLPGRSQRRWMCRCVCGETVDRETALLLAGRATHCGCQSAARSAANLQLAVAKNTRHGAALDGMQSPEYRVWHGIRSRCYVKSQSGYERYGGRGVRVCDEWLGPGGFERFLAHVGPKPSERHSLDRFPNRKGHYEPGNVRWATPEEQAENRDCTVYLEVDGERLPLAEWSRRSGLSQSTLRGRHARGWSGREAISRPARVTERRTA